MDTALELPANLIDSLRTRAQRWGLPGLALAMVGQQGRRAVCTLGLEGSGPTRPVTAETRFSVASTGKHVTAVAVLEAAQAGRVDLTAPIGRYLNDVPLPWADRSVASLLRHTSGLPEYLAHPELGPVPTDRAAFMRQYGALVPAFAEGKGWIYTNTNYILLGFLIAALSGQPYAQSLQDLFDRVRCPGATVGGPGWARESNARGLPANERDLEAWAREVIGDGDLVLTAPGALRWLEVLLGGDMLTPSSRVELFSPAALASGRASPYGCGWFLDRLPVGVVAHHGGHFDGWSALAYLLPERGIGAMLMCNLAPGNTRAVRDILQWALEAWQPGSTPLALTPLRDDAPALTATAFEQLLRSPDAPLDLGCFADELKRVAAHANQVRNIVNLWAGEPPAEFLLVEQQWLGSCRLRRYRLQYADRVEHLLVGTTPEDLIYWAWPL